MELQILAAVGGLVGIVSPLCALVFGYAAFRRSRKQDEQQAGQQSGLIMAELGNLRADIREIKTRMDARDDQYIQIIGRVVAVEESSKQAHKRLDALERGRGA